LSAGSASVAEILDDTGDLASAVAAPWMGLLWLTALPLRLVQAEIAARVIQLGPESSRYGNLLLALAAAGAAALVLATAGRAVYARACLLASRTGERPGREALAVGLVPFFSHLYLALLAEVLFFGLCLTAVAVPMALSLAALAAAVAPLVERPSLVEPVRAVAAAARGASVLLGLQVVFAVAFVIAFANVIAAFHAGLWLAGAVPGLDLAVWAHRLSLTNPRFLLLATAGAILVVEPFWLAAHVVFVHHQRARRSGEDLRARFERLRAREAVS
jgi:hypothetical protein